MASLASLKFLVDAWRVSRRRDGTADDYRAEKKLFGTSIVYLFAVFGALIADALLRALIGPFGWPVWL